MSYSALRKDKNFSCRKLAKALSEKFPVINAQAISYAERPRDSGITYTMEARRYIDLTNRDAVAASFLVGEGSRSEAWTSLL